MSAIASPILDESLWACAPDSYRKAPFPAFGGKSRIMGEIYARIDGVPGSISYDPVRNLIDPFTFSVSSIWNRPIVGAVETINDRNAFVANFWRAVDGRSGDPEAVAHYCDWPVNETDLHARHRWLVNSDTARAALGRVREDPEAFDARIAGWWCWGACCWIGSGWCDETHRNAGAEQRPHLATDGGGSGVHRLSEKRPRVPSPKTGWAPGVIGPGVRQPALGQAGWGVNAKGEIDDTHRPQLADQFARGRGVHGHDQAGSCARRAAWIRGWILALADRLRPVRVCCGHWSRVCDSESTMTRLGTTGVILDPPYAHDIARVQVWVAFLLGEPGAEPPPAVVTKGKKNRTKHIYANDRTQDVDYLCAEVTVWCLKWGPVPGVRIALCGLEGEYPRLEAEGWNVLAWKSNGGYGNRSKSDSGGNENARRERVWFSPGCLKPETAGGLFA